ncbi:MAG: phosphatase PAP2 family protein [Solirubrobacteraceae bacterium]|nr:phosphatase PAP2 family protein [Solirubrobacteraceae bacterium]
MSLRRSMHRADVWLYAEVARLHTPFVDRELRHLTHSADHGRLWFAAAAVLGLCGGACGRRAGRDGLLALGVASAVTNIALKPLGGRRRPDRDAHDVPAARHVRMPGSTSFPSGHSASAIAFSVAAAHGLPRSGGIPIRALGLLVAYTRVHAGVHYPGDVLAGGAVGWIAARVITRRRAGR